MSDPERSAKKKALPWIIATLAYIGPPTWAYVVIERDAAAQKAAHGWVCGNSTMGVILLTCLASGLLSSAAFAGRAFTTKWWAEISLAPRTAEIFFLGFPAVIAILCILLLYTG